MIHWIRTAMLLLIWLLPAPVRAQNRLRANDHLRMRSVGDVQLSPDGTRIAYTIVNNDGEGRPSSQLWLIEPASSKMTRVGGETHRGGRPTWSPDGTRIAFIGQAGNQSGLFVSRADGSGVEFLAPMLGTNSSALVNTGEDVAWAPDGKQIAFVHATPGPESAEAEGDPIVITRYLYKPTFSEGNTRFNDNRRLHIFAVDLNTKKVRQLTDGVYYEHSIDWSPNGEELAFVSNREPKPDEFFNNDLFALRVADGSIRRLTATESAEYQPRWSPDGKTIAYQATRRGLTDLETTMEDTHIWTISASGTNPRELGAPVDNRQGSPEWAPDGSAVYFTVQERGNVRLYRAPIGGGKPEAVLVESGIIGAFSLGRSNQIAYLYTSPRDLAQLYLKNEKGSTALTSLNTGVLAGKDIATTESLTFISNDNKHEVEAFLTKPLGMTPTSKHPLNGTSGSIAIG
jgi:Tol biopolymer transport system component